MKVALFIPGIPKNANARSQWAKYAANRDRQKFRGLAADIASEHYAPHGTFTVPVQITARHISPHRRRRDPLGLAERLKPIVDGIVDAGLLIDDDETHISVRLEPSEKGPEAGIHVTLEPIGAIP